MFRFCLCGDPRPLNSCCQASIDRSGQKEVYYQARALARLELLAINFFVFFLNLNFGIA